MGTLEVIAQLVLRQALRSLDFIGRCHQPSQTVHLWRDMPTIRDLVSALRRRDGVDAAIVLGRDGLLIDGATTAAHDAEQLAAYVPPMVIAAAELGAASGRGDFGIMVLEYATGVAVISSVSAEALLLIVLRPGANLPSLLFDLRRHRAQIAALA